MNRYRIIIAAALVAGAAAGYYVGYDHGSERSVTKGIGSFTECMAAGYPVMESYPRQCRTPDGRLFVEVIDEEPVVCTADVQRCPDGSYVGRIPPDCRFAECR